MAKIGDSLLHAAEIPVLGEFARSLTEQCVFRQDGSGFNIDFNDGPDKGHNISAIASLILAVCPRRQLIYNAVGGIGFVNFKLSEAVAKQNGNGLEYTMGNDNPADLDPVSGYGFHPTVEHRRVLLVQDVVNTGDEVAAAVGIIRRQGGCVADGVVVLDRSRRKVLDIGSQLGVSLRSLFYFDEHNGRICVAGHSS